jgi:hypothetical protein
LFRTVLRGRLPLYLYMHQRGEKRITALPTMKIRDGSSSTAGAAKLIENTKEEFLEMAVSAFARLAEKTADWIYQTEPRPQGSGA